MNNVQIYLNSLAALYAWRAKSTESTNERLGVLFVLRNRTKQDWGDAGSVITKALYEQEVYHQVYNFPDVRDPEFQKVLQFSNEVFNDEILDNLTGGAVYFTPEIETAGAIERVAKIGNTEFYKSRK